MTESRASSPWDFDYGPISMGGGDDDDACNDLVLATTSDVDPARIAELLAGQVPDLSVVPLFNAHPIFWTRIESSQPISRETLVRRVEETGVSVRFVTSARRGAQRLPPLLDCASARPRKATEWTTRVSTADAEPVSPWRWFLRREGVDVDRSVCGSGAGTRLAIIDNDGRDLDKIKLDAEVPVGVDAIPRAAAHTASLLGWAVGAKRADGSWFRGIAPDTSPRFYCIPKAGDEVVSLPLAIVRAVEDGADVVVCATYVEGLTSPLLDDALEFAIRLGRGGRGTAVVLPTGREMSSPANSVHSSLSLGMSDPASDPRVFCVGPSSRDGGWFLWRDRLGRLRPFANRGPSIRWLAPGDDMANPFTPDDRPGHAESSGASAIAAGVLLLAIASNAELNLSELDALLSETSSPVDAGGSLLDPEIADKQDLMPIGVDADGHNAKHGYGRLSATRACLSARDPVALVLVRMGEPDAAGRYVEAVSGRRFHPVYGESLARWAATVTLRDSRVAHAIAAVVRTVRLGCRHPARVAMQPPGHLLRHVTLVVRLLLGSGPKPAAVAELRTFEKFLMDAVRAPTAREIETAVFSFAEALAGWGSDSNRGVPQASRATEERATQQDQRPISGAKKIDASMTGSRP